jgi:hypothetical protein
MQVNVDFEKYAKNVLKMMEKQLKNERGEEEKEMLKRDIEKHKDKYSEYLK